MGVFLFWVLSSQKGGTLKICQFKAGSFPGCPFITKRGGPSNKIVSLRLVVCLAVLKKGTTEPKPSWATPQFLTLYNHTPKKRDKRKKFTLKERHPAP